MRILIIILYYLFIVQLLATIINIPVDQTTIQAGINASVNSDTVLVQPGTYFENINYNGKNIKIASLFLTTQDTAFISQTIIDGNQNGSVITFENSEDTTSVLIGFRIVNGSAGEGGGIHCNDSSPSLLNLQLMNNWGNGAGGAISCTSYSSPTIENVIIKSNSAVSGGGIACIDYSNPTLKNVLIANNDSNSAGGGIVCRYSNPILINVTISVNSDGGGIGGGISLAFDSELTAINSIIWNNYPNNIEFRSYNEPNSIIISYSDIQDGEAGIVINNNGTVSWLEGNIDADPLFADPLNGNFHLTQNSPCIDAGDPNFPLDPNGTIVDMGAFCYDQSNNYSGPVWHVSTTGSDSTGTGSFEYPFASIQHGIEYTVDSDTVLVQPGIYFENINYNGKLITITSLFYTTQDTSYISQTIIDGESNNHVVEFSSEEDSTAILSGLTITNGFALKGGGIYCVGSSPKLENLTISGNTISGEWMHYGGGIYMDESSSMLKNLIIKNNTAGGTSRSRGGGIYCIGSTPNLNNVLIEDNEVFSYERAFGGGIYCSDDSHIYLYNVIMKNNIVWNGTWNHGGGIYINDSSAEFYNVVVTGNGIGGETFNKGAGIFCEYSSLNLFNSTIVNNEVVDGTMYETGGLYSGFDSQINVTNCILWNNFPLNIHCHSDTAIVNYSNIQGGWAGEGNIDEDPLFVSSGDHPFMLLDDSPCVNYGIQDTLGLNLPALDIVGNPRIFGGRIDMGAYENQNVVVGTDENLIPITTKLKQNYPNPFNPTTTISFSIQDDSKIELSIYNIKGQKINTLLNNQITSGEHLIVWNGEDAFGKKVSSGVYLYKLNVNGKIEAVKKCLLLK